ncbi:hypothetical protein K470DRAFT_156817 [Piedraia hortae CBS 480.64]|uniref:Uncharacterized protein n=1 Tax=Piedraia hortae CBS 480.64 TaxID=1314780 RepID=A0A6A7BRD9_9PEZI|nr:hypothetical protein K470DRAFT_156817 [Piedraia hortae CBS 480.64]
MVTCLGEVLSFHHAELTPSLYTPNIASLATSPSTSDSGQTRYHKGNPHSTDAIYAFCSLTGADLNMTNMVAPSGQTDDFGEEVCSHSHSQNASSSFRTLNTDNSTLVPGVEKLDELSRDMVIGRCKVGRLTTDKKPTRCLQSCDCCRPITPRDSALVMKISETPPSRHRVM